LTRPFVSRRTSFLLRRFHVCSQVFCFFDSYLAVNVLCGGVIHSHHCGGLAFFRLAALSSLSLWLRDGCPPVTARKPFRLRPLTDWPCRQKNPVRLHRVESSPHRLFAVRACLCFFGRLLNLGQVCFSLADFVLLTSRSIVVVLRFRQGWLFTLDPLFLSLLTSFPLTF
jgi:hypothetical protein